MKNKILLAKVEAFGRKYVPFGIMYVADALRKAGYEPILFHGHANKMQEFKKLVEQNKDDLLFVGFSTMTSEHLVPTLEASRFVKAQGLPVAWGGVHATILPDLCLSEACVDFVIMGEGEETTVELANALSKSKPAFAEVKGLAFKKNGKAVKNEWRSFIADLDAFMPAYDLIDLSKYVMKKYGCERMLPMMSSRGCPFRCGFCYNSAVNKRTWRKHSVEHVLKQVEYLKEKYKIDGIYMHDDFFFCDLERAKKILDTLGMPWFSEIRADFAEKPEFLEWLKKNGECRILFIGAESGSQRVLNYIQKDLKKEDIFVTVTNLKETNIPLDLSFITGFPTETEEEMMQTLGFIDELQEANPRVSAALKIFNPYPMTPLWQPSLDNGFIPPKTNEEWAQYDRETCRQPWANKRRLEAIVKVAAYACLTLDDEKHADYKLIGWFEKLRWKHRWFSAPFEVSAVRRLRNIVRKNPVLYRLATRKHAAKTTLNN